MVDSCYEKIEYMDLVRLFAVNTEQNFLDLQTYVKDLKEKGEISWSIQDRNNIVKEKQERARMSADSVISDMISYVRLNERIL